MIAIIDYDIGNVSAIENMLSRIGVISEITNDFHKINKAEKIILPGNGSYDACILGLRKTGLIPLLEEMVLGRETPILGICVGAQMLGNASEEGQESGLGWVDMNVKRLPNDIGIKVPHMGWSEVITNLENVLLTNSLEKDARFYFSHSYYMAPKNNCDIALICNYGIKFAAAISVKNILGVQFHPEKSHRFGKGLLKNFATSGTL